LNNSRLGRNIAAPSLYWNRSGSKSLEINFGKTPALPEVPENADLLVEPIKQG
jgi:hypothetical protein